MKLPPDHLLPSQRKALRHLYERFVSSTAQDSAVDAANVESLTITVSSQPRNDNGLPKSDGGREYKPALYANIRVVCFQTSSERSLKRKPSDLIDLDTLDALSESNRSVGPKKTWASAEERHINGFFV